MVNVSSLPVSGGSSFVLDTQAGVTQLLVSIRASEITADDKNDIRDLVFQYTNGGKDITVRRALEQKIVSLGIAPVAPKVTQAPLPPPPLIGTFRMAPAFVPPVATSVTAPVAPTRAAAPIAPPVVEVEQPAPIAVTHEQVTEIASQVTEPAIPVASPTPEPTPEPEQPSAQVVAPVEDNQVYLNRIREIKAIVNERVGNPVNLVDIDNAVGREYMSALLDAMKKLNSGSSPVPAMRRLEAAFIAVEETLEKHDAQATEAALDAQPEEPVGAPATSAPATITPEAPEDTASIEPTPWQAAAEETVAPLSMPSPVQTSWQPPVSEEVVPPAPYTPPAPAAATSGWNAVPTKTIQPLVHSLAESEPLKTPASLPVTRATEVPATVGDPLHTEEVNQGLEQLLLEWSLFKKSGLFGTGPKGREHPLFKKIAGLQIPLLLAGRFEGATQEIKQSITDYMNGWRYEQGIIYEPGELFEHYLRRVIRHILDLQKTKIR